MTFRIEKDILGEIKVPSDAYWGVNTQRAIQNFQISGKIFPQIFILSIAQVKKASLLSNMELGLVDDNKGNAILKAIDEIIEEHKFLDQFPIDIYQTGSGTQTNMNMNEVLANRANEILGYPKGNKHPIHPNDDVNRCQSSNDVIPSVMHLATIHLMNSDLFPALIQLKKSINQKINEFNNIIKVGRTHLQDAVPIPLSLEFEVYKQQIETSENRLKNVYSELQHLPIGGSALGTGLNVQKGFTEKALKYLNDITKIKFYSNPVKAEGISSHNTIANVSANLKMLALSLLKMANDIRWMGSGPRAGLSELILPQNEPGSSIMPGKINPTQSEALIQVCLQVMGNDSVISFAEAYGSILDLNVCKPLMISNLLESITILSGAINSFIFHCLEGLQANKPQIARHLEQLIMLVTNLTPIIGYDKCSIIAKRAHEENKTIKEVIKDMGIQIEGDIDEILDPKKDGVIIKMNLEEVRNEARKKLKGICGVYKDCDGSPMRICQGQSYGKPLKFGGIGSGTSFHNNFLAFRKYNLKMKVIGDHFKPDTSYDFFGNKVSLPVMAASVAGVNSFGGESVISEKEFCRSVVLGSKAAGTVGWRGDSYTYSLENTFGIDAIAEANGWGVKIVKPRDQDTIMKFFKKAEQIGCIAVGIDVDGCESFAMSAHNIPVFRKNLDDLKELVNATVLPVIIKGVMTPEDAELAHQAGAAAIVVSNHGGRVLDHTPGTLDALSKIAAQVKGKIKIFLDGGVRTGYDVIKALASGAEAVLIGRDIVRAAVGARIEGVRIHMEYLQKTLSKAMKMTNCKKLSEIDAELLV